MSDLITVQSSATNISCVTSLLSLESLFLKGYLHVCCVFLEWVSSTTRPERDCSVGIAIISCMHQSCYYQLGVTTSVWACEDTGAELT